MGLTTIRISIKKVLPAGIYAYGQMENISFASEYLVQTEAAFPSSQITAYARNLAEAESHLFPSCVRFERAQIKQVMPNPDDAQRGFAHVELDDLRGQWQIEAEDRLAYPPVTAVYGRSTSSGAHGRLNFPYVLSTKEWNLYTQLRTVPERLAVVETRPASGPSSLFSHRLIEAVKPSNGRHIMLGSMVSGQQRIRLIIDFYSKGLQVPIKTKKRRMTQSRQATALYRAELRAFMDGVEFDPTIALAKIRGKGKAKPKAPSAGIVYLIKAGPHYKIGKSINVDKRLEQIKLILPYPIEVIHKIRAADHSRAESFWHRRFKASRVRGEWFELTEADVKEFKSITEMPLDF